MKRSILITSYDMEIGGVERSLSAMLNNFDYLKNEVDLHLHSHTGPLLSLLPQKVNLLPELSSCKTYRQPIKQILFSGHIKLAFKRFYAKMLAERYAKKNQLNDAGYFQFQEIWRVCNSETQKIEKDYNVAISYLWPHHFTAFNVTAKTKIAWIHTDYSTIDIDVKADLAVWQQFDYIISISDACTEAFLKVHPSLKAKIVLVENITSPDYVRTMADKPIEHTFSKETFNLVSVGRLCEPKAFDRAAEALALVHTKGFTHIKWYIVGDGGDKAKIQAQIERYNLQDSFILLGSTTNPYPYMKAADLYVQPSRYEGKAVTISEAQILAKPVLITHYATADSQVMDSVDGLICEQSVEGIANAIIDLYHNPTLRNCLSSFCRQQDYTNTDELKKLYELLD